MTSVTEVSYIGNPRSRTAMYATAKVARLIERLHDVENCVVFVETGVEVPMGIMEKNTILFSDNPVYDYVEFVRRIEKSHEMNDRQIPWNKTESGAMVSSAATIGEGAYIEPGVVIGPGVIIGRDATILANASIRHAAIGNGVLINESAVVGCNCYTMTHDANGLLMRIPALGRVEIADEVEIGPCDTIARGSSESTRIGSRSKLDARVHLGESVQIGDGVELAAGATIAGYAEVGDCCFIGLDATVKNRVRIAGGTTIGMGAVVTKNIRTACTVFGNPAVRISVG